jgi:hypothetical protein
MLEVENTGKNTTVVRLWGSQWLFAYETLVAAIVPHSRGINRFLGIKHPKQTTNKYVCQFLGRPRKQFDTVAQEDLQREFRSWLYREVYEDIVTRVDKIKGLCVADSAPARIVNHLDALVIHMEGEMTS